MAELILPFVLAIAPVIWLVVALCVLHVQSWQAACGFLVVAAVLAAAYWHMGAMDLATAALEGFVFAIWPISLIIFSTVFIYNLTVHTGAMDIIKQMLCTISNDKRIIALLLAWSFGCFLEGMAGFGTGVAIPAGMMVAMGINPAEAILTCLVTNVVPTMFGSIGTPTTSLSAIAGVDIIELGIMQVVQVLPLALICPFFVVGIAGGGPRAIKGVIPAILASGISFGVTELLVAMFMGPNMCAVLGGVVAMGATFVSARKRRGDNVPAEYALTERFEGDDPLTAAQCLKAWSPFIIVLVAILLTSSLVPAINVPLSAIRSSVTIYSGEGASPLTLSWVNTPGVLVLISAVIASPIIGASPKDFLLVLGSTAKQMWKTVVTMLGVLGAAKIMGYSGMVTSIAVFFVTVFGPFYPAFAPIVGALGSFVTGSGTTSGLLFGGLQAQTAEAIGADATWLVAANSLGSGAGKIIAPQSIAIGTAACKSQGEEGALMKRALKFAIASAVIMAAIVFFGAKLV